MATADSLQKPKILAVEGSVIRIQHPNTSGYSRTHLGAQIAAAGTGMTVLDNNRFSDNDWMVVGEVGDAKTETTDVNGAVTRGTSLTVTNSLNFAHELDAPVTRILERGITIYGAASDGGSGTIIESVDAFMAVGKQIANAVMIQWDKPYTEYNLITTDTAYDYYYVEFTDGITTSDASDYVAATGAARSSAYAMIQNALDMTGAEADDAGDITWDFLVRAVQDWQDYVVQWVDPSSGIKKDWSFEYISDDTSIALTEMENEYALSGLSTTMKYGETKQSIVNMRMGSYRTNYIPIDVYDRKLHGKVRTTVATAITALDTSIVLTDTYELAESGTVTIGADTITYTANTESTSTLSGCTGVDNSHAVDAAVWQNVSGGKPYEWTIYNGVLKFAVPPSATYAGYPIRMKYIRELTAISEISDTTIIPFFNTCQYYVAYKIELKRQNAEMAAYYKNLCDVEVMRNARSDKSYTTETYEYYKVRDGYYSDTRWRDWNSDVYTP